MGVFLSGFDSDAPAGYSLFCSSPICLPVPLRLVDTALSKGVAPTA